MPYDQTSGLPDSVRSVLPRHAQDIYKEAFNSAWDEYSNPKNRRDNASREEVAHRVAWHAVGQKYEKGGDGKWNLKDYYLNL